MENGRNLVKDKPISYSINESSAEDNSDGEYRSTNVLWVIWDGKHVHLNTNAGYARLRIRDQIRKTKSKWKGKELSDKVWAKFYTSYLS